MTSSDADRLESLYNFVFYLYNQVKKYDYVCCEGVLWRQFLKYIAFLILPLYLSGMTQFYPQIFLLFIVCNSVIQAWSWSTKGKESFGCIISKFILSCSWVQEGHECREFNINTDIQSSFVYASGKLLKKHFILFCTYQKTDSKWKLLKSRLFPIFWIKNLMWRTITAFLKAISLVSFSEGNLFISKI